MGNLLRKKKMHSFPNIIPLWNQGIFLCCKNFKCENFYERKSLQMHDWYFCFCDIIFICRHIPLFKISYFYCHSTRDFALDKIFPTRPPFYWWEILLCETEPRPLQGSVHWDEHLAQRWSIWAMYFVDFIPTH